jgi:cobalt/nickel transport system ATP-binding protein
MGIALEILDLHYRYPDGTKALRGFRAAIGENECVGLVGPNGAGKTTLLLALAGFLHPNAGEFRLLGESIPFTQTTLLRRAIGFSFSNPDDQLFMPTVLDDVCFGPLCQGQAQELATAQAREILTALGIGELQQHFPGHLSSGQKRLAALAGVLVMNPQILAFDEPTAFLDPYSRRQVARIIGKIPHTKLLVTHDLELVLDLCSKVIVIFDGQNVCEGMPSTVLGNDELMESYHLETPYSLRRSACCSAARKN